MSVFEQTAPVPCCRQSSENAGSPLSLGRHENHVPKPGREINKESSLDLPLAGCWWVQPAPLAWARIFLPGRTSGRQPGQLPERRAEGLDVVFGGSSDLRWG